jgi:hypothetical protein
MLLKRLEKVPEAIIKYAISLLADDSKVAAAWASVPGTQILEANK